MIRLLESISFGRTLYPACLQTDVHDEDLNTEVIECGWSQHTSRSADILKSNLQTMPLSQCNTTVMDYNKYGSSRIFQNGISKSQLCAYDPNDMRQNCRILSGGAFKIFPSISSFPQIVGITSFGFGGGCGIKQPAIFTRVANYIPWIEAIVWPFERSKLQF